MGSPNLTFMALEKETEDMCWVGREAELDLGVVGGRGVVIKAHCLKELIKNEEEKVVRSEQEMYPREKPLMGPGGNTGNCLPLTHKELHSHSLLV